METSLFFNYYFLILFILSLFATGRIFVLNCGILSDFHQSGNFIWNSEVNPNKNKVILFYLGLIYFLLFLTNRIIFKEAPQLINYLLLPIIGLIMVMFYYFIEMKIKTPTPKDQIINKKTRLINRLDILFNTTEKNQKESLNIKNSVYDLTIKIDLLEDSNQQILNSTNVIDYLKVSVCDISEKLDITEVSNQQIMENTKVIKEDLKGSFFDMSRKLDLSEVSNQQIIEINLATKEESKKWLYDFNSILNSNEQNLKNERDLKKEIVEGFVDLSEKTKNIIEIMSNDRGNSKDKNSFQEKLRPLKLEKNILEEKPNFTSGNFFSCDFESYKNLVELNEPASKIQMLSKNNNKSVGYRPFLILLNELFLEGLTILSDQEVCYFIHKYFYLEVSNGSTDKIFFDKGLVSKWRCANLKKNKSVKA